MKVRPPDPIRLNPGPPAPSGRMWPASPGDWHHAPDHLVALIAALAPCPPPGPTGEPTYAHWYANLRRVVDQVWSTGWLAGASDALANLPPQPIMVVPESALPPAVVAGAGRTEQGRASVSTRPGTRS